MNDLSNDQVIYVNKDGVEYLQFRKLLEYSDIISHAYSVGINKNYRTELPGGKRVSDEEYKETIKNFEKLTNTINSDVSHVIKARQKHTRNVKCVNQKSDEPEFYNENYKDTDGLITDKPKIMLATTNADCILLLFFDPVKRVIANTHSGWKGTLQRISVETVKKMKKEYGCKPENIICCMCPSIRKCHFEVDNDVKDEFESEFKELNKEEFIEEKIPGEKWNIDTIYLNKKILLTEGLKKENIIDSNICSVCNKEQIHSFRAEGENYGLATAIIEIKG